MMTETEWISGNHNPQGMLWTLRDLKKITRTKAGKRKSRLFACGYCRFIWDRIADPRSKSAVEVAERFADGQANKGELTTAYEAAYEVAFGLSSNLIAVNDAWNPEHRALSAAVSTAEDVAFHGAFVLSVGSISLEEGYTAENRKSDTLMCDLLRCVFGNPYRPVAVEPSWKKWNDGLIPKIAEGIYAERAFDRLPILHDALLDAGCDNADILTHCRAGGIHVRGCWVVDILRNAK
jgi:hypothetical protein